jgi:spore coat polysaccharide biosynthesis protein SpsF
MVANKIVALIQARMGSTRLPGKVLMDICGKPVIWHIWNRLKNVSEISEVVVATSEEQSNDILIKYCHSVGIPYSQGSENEVLDRFYQAAAFHQASAIVRVTGDCPLIDPGTISLVIQKFLKSNFDHVAVAAGAGVLNRNVNKFPDGTDAEVIAFKALQMAWQNATDPLDRGEAVTSFIWRNKDIFRCDTISSEKDLGHLRWTLDRPEDLIFIRNIYGKLFNLEKCFSIDDILKLIEEEPELSKINESWIGEEGYEKYYKI